MSKTTKSSGKFVWIDCEMTGLELEKEALIEIAVIVTDPELNPLDPGLEIIINTDQKYLDSMNSYVRKMHEASGLLEAIKNKEGIERAEAAAKTLEYIKDLTPGKHKAYLAGNSVGQDKLFLSRDMPDVIDYLHYRIIDVSTIKELANLWDHEIYEHAPQKTGNHRALMDIKDSINELGYYKKALLDPSASSFEFA